MLKRILNGTIAATILLTGSAVVPVFGHGSSPNAAAAQEDKMKNDKMTGDKMTGDKMTGNMMSSKRHKHRRHRKHKMGRKMDTMQSNKKM